MGASSIRELRGVGRRHPARGVASAVVWVVDWHARLGYSSQWESIEGESGAVGEKEKEEEKGKPISPPSKFLRTPVHDAADGAVRLSYR